MAIVTAGLKWRVLVLVVLVVVYRNGSEWEEKPTTATSEWSPNFA